MITKGWAFIMPAANRIQHDIKRSKQQACEWFGRPVGSVQNGFQQSLAFYGLNTSYIFQKNSALEDFGFHGRMAPMSIQRLEE